MKLFPIMYVVFHISGNLFKLRKEGHVCGTGGFGSGDLGVFKTVTECALACKNHTNTTCKHFSYRRWIGFNVDHSGRCILERTIPPNCPTGFVKANDFDFYALSGTI